MKDGNSSKQENAQLRNHDWRNQNQNQQGRQWIEGEQKFSQWMSVGFSSAGMGVVKAGRVYALGIV